MAQRYSNRLCKSRSQERPPEYVHTSSRRRWHHRASHSAHDEQCWATGHPRVVHVDLLLRPLEHPFGRHSSLWERSSCVKGSYFQPSDHSRVFMSLPKSRGSPNCSSCDTARRPLIIMVVIILDGLRFAKLSFRTHNQK